MYKPLVTIVIPVYDGSNYLEESIHAALNQTYENIEIIVVNDGSNDNDASERIALSFGDKIIYYDKENGGVSSALNVAISHMKGEWFSWLSHDDLYKPEKIQRQIEFLNTLLEANQCIDLHRTVVYCANETIDINGKVIKKKRFAIPIHMNQLDMILENMKNYRIGGCAVLIPRHSFTDVGLFNEEIRTASDKQYWYRMLFKNYQFYFLNERLVQNRAHRKQVGKVNVDLFLKESNYINKWIVDQLWEIEHYRNWWNFWKLGCYLEKRFLKEGSQQAFDYARKLMNPFIFKVLYPEFVLYYRMTGIIRNTIRFVYRKLRVK